MTIHVASTYKELREDDGLHAWSYKVEFRNEGKTTVQLMTRQNVGPSMIPFPHNGFAGATSGS